MAIIDVRITKYIISVSFLSYFYAKLMAFYSVLNA